MITLKLPFRQAGPLWKFPDRAAFLEGKLTLKISRPASTNTIVIFDRGQLQDGWGDLPLPRAVAGEMYFGLKSSKKYLTAPGDRLELELEVKQDLKCIGPSRQGVLSAGTYQTFGSYSGLIDEFKPNPGSKGTTQETTDAMRRLYAWTALLQNWQEQWDLRITSEKGWLPPTRELGTERIQRVAKVTSSPGSGAEIEHAPPGPEPARGARGLASP